METVVYLVLFAAVLALVATALLPRSSSVRVTGRVPAGAERIFAVITDLDQTSAWRPGYARAERVHGKDGPARRQALHGAGPEARMTVEQVTTWVENRQYGVKVVEEREGDRPRKGLRERRTVVTLQPRENGTEVDLVGEWEAGSFWGRWAAKFRMPGEVRAEYAAILERLRTIS